jgi:hypothetical protein
LYAVASARASGFWIVGGRRNWSRVCGWGFFLRRLLCGFGFGAFALLVAAIVELLVGCLFLHGWFLWPNRQLNL